MTLQIVRSCKLEETRILPWYPSGWHRVKDAVAGTHHIWRQTLGGVEVFGEDALRRTSGAPTTLRRIVTEYGEEIAEACAILDIPDRLVAATIAAESHGTPTAERAEPHIHDVSIGLTQILTATAAGLMTQAPAHLGVMPKLKPLPQGGDIAEWRALLRQPFYAIRLAALYYRIANDKQELQLDPVLCYAAYNAGSARSNASRPWHLHYYRAQLPDGRWADAMNNFVKWYNDACFVYAER